MNNPYLTMARSIEGAASIASNMGELGLANQLWDFEQKLRQKASDYKLTPKGSASKTGSPETAKGTQA